jgi:hypothetical protein
MPFADNLTTRTVVGTFVTPRGVPADGYITFTPQVTTHNTENDNLILHSPVKKNLDASGSFSVELVDTDNADLLPSGWGYSIEYRATGIPNRVFFAYVPAGDDELNVADLIPLDVEDIDPDLYTPHSIVYGNSGGVPTTMTIPQDSVVGRLNSGVVTIPIADLDSPEAMLYLGAWDNETAYAQYSVVSYDDALWVWPTDDESTVGEAPDTDNGWFAVSGGAATIESIDGLQDALDSKATPGDITTAIDEVLDSAPGALDTLNELAAALGDDANFATTMTNALAGKADSTDLDAYALLSGLGTMATATASDYLSKAGNLSGIADPAAARTNLGLGTMATASASAYAALAGATFTGDVTFGTTSGIRLGYGGRFFDPDATRTVLLANGNKLDVLDETGASYLFQAGGNGVGLTATNGLTANANAVSVIPLKAKGFSGQTANLFEAQNSSSTVIASISANGTGTFPGVSTQSIVNGATLPYLDINSTRNGVSIANRNTTSVVPFHVQGMASQSGNLTNWIDSSGSVLAFISAAGAGSFTASQTISANADTVGPMLLLKDTSANAASRIWRISNAMGSSPYGALGFQVGTAAGGTPTNDPKLILLSDGKVGVGIITPTSLLHVAGQTFVDGSADTIQLRVQGHSTQTADIFKVETSAGTKIGGWDQWGQLNTQYITDTTGVSPYLRFQTNSLMAINQSNAANVAFAVRGMAAQSGALTLWQDSSYNTLASISAAGHGTFAGLRVPASQSIYLGSIGNSEERIFATNTRFGYSAAYRAIMLGSSSTASSGTLAAATISFGYDPSINASGSFNGNGGEVIFRNGMYFKVPNATDDGWMKVQQLNVDNVTTRVQHFIDGSADVIQSRVQGHSSQTANLQTWENSAGSVLSYVGALGEWRTSGTFGSTTAGKAYLQPNTDTGAFAFFTNNAANKGVVVRGHASQTANLQEWQNSSATALAYVSALGGSVFATTAIGTTNQYGAVSSINTVANGNLGLVIRAAGPSQSANMLEVQNSSAGALASISAAGAIKGASIGPVSASTFNILDNTGGAVATARTTDFLVNYRLIAGSTTGTEAFKSVGNSLLTVSNATHIPVQVRGFTSQTANLQTWENSAGSVLVRVNADGEFCGTYISDLAQIAPYITMSGDRILLRNRTTTSNVPLDVRGMAGQTGDLQQWRNSAASVLASISAAGAGTFNGVTVAAGYSINASHAATGTTRYGVNAVNSVATGTGNSAFGYQAATSLTTGFSNVAMGYRALYVNTTGNYNTAIGHSTLLALASGDGNTALGWNALTAANGTTKNTAVGMWAQKVLASGNYNTTVGAESQYALNGGANNTSLGYGSLQGVTTGSGNIAIGYLAGMYATTQSNELFINSINRTDRAGDIAGSIIYGVQHATPANQTLTLNAAVTATYGLATTAGVFSDSATVNVTESDKGFRVVDSSISHAGALYRDQISIGGSQAGGSAGAIFYANSDGDGIATANLVLNTVGVLGYNGITLSGSIDGNTNTTSTWYIENQITASAYGLKIRHEKGSGAPGVDAAIDISENLELITVASTTTNAGIRLPHGVAPTSPVDGQMWTDTGGVKTRIDGVTENVVGSTTLLKMEALTQAEYDLLTPDANTFYVITDGA